MISFDIANKGNTADRYAPADFFVLPRIMRMFNQRMIAVGIALVIVMATLGACNSKSVLAVPTFEIRISLTPAAKEKLAKAGESIKGTIFFD